MNEVYQTDDYRKAIIALLASAGSDNKEMSVTTLSLKTRIEKSYLSKVIKGNRDLSADQLYVITEVLSVNEKISAYLHLLLDYSRTAVAKRKKELRARIQAIRIQERDIRKNLKLEMVGVAPSETVQQYYLNPAGIVVHHFLTIEKYAHQPERIANVLGVSSDYLATVISELQRLGLIVPSKNGEGFSATPIHLHLPSDSHIYGAFHEMMRALSSQQVQRVPTKHRMTFTMTFTADEPAKAQIHESFLSFLKETEKVIAKAPSQEVYQMNFDLFPWTSGTLKTDP